VDQHDCAAVVFEGCVYCVGCLPLGVTVDDAEVSPIEPDEQWDAAAACERCGLEHDYMNVACG
jgi:hypothetical protein